MTSLTSIGILICLIILFVSVGVEILISMRESYYNSVASCLDNCSYESSYWYTDENYVDCVMSGNPNECFYSRLEQSCKTYHECGCCNITLNGGVKK